MKRILKGAEPSSFTAWKASANEDWQPSWEDNFQNPEKRNVRVALAVEQGWICCYCCCAIGELDDPSGAEPFHIEHLRPRSDFEEKALDYENLLASCGHPRRPRPSQTIRCGDAKEDWYDADLFVSPLDESCESRFSFTANGEIGPRRSDDEAARETIRRLRLDESSLREQRAAAIDGTLPPEILVDYSTRDLEKLLEGLRTRGEGGRFASFSPALCDVIEGLLPASRGF